MSAAGSVVKRRNVTHKPRAHHRQMLKERAKG
jgi:hypothetical protein